MVSSEENILLMFMDIRCPEPLLDQGKITAEQGYLGFLVYVKTLCGSLT